MFVYQNAPYIIQTKTDFGNFFGKTIMDIGWLPQNDRIGRDETTGRGGCIQKRSRYRPSDTITAHITASPTQTVKLYHPRTLRSRAQHKTRRYKSAIGRGTKVAEIVVVLESGFESALPNYGSICCFYFV